MAARVSIITTTYTPERLEDLKQLLDSVSAQSFRDFDMFVIVERSSELADSISEYIAKNGYNEINVHFNDGPRGVSANRNLALQKVRGDIVAFVDDDATVSREWVDEIVRTFNEDSSVIGVTGPVLPVWQKESMTWFPAELYWIFSCSYDVFPNKVEVRNGYGTNLAFKMEAIREAGLFNTALGVRGRGSGGWQEPGGEETELALKIKSRTGKRIIFNPKVEVHHKVYSYRLSIRFIVRRAFWEGYTKALLKDKYRSLKTRNGVLATEHTLLRRIVFHRIPQALKMLFRHPVTAVNQLGAVFVVLTCVSIGYCRYEWSAIFRSEKR
jgi:glucosyl-dolichyl phosphate glucuronosyltransferase